MCKELPLAHGDTDEVGSISRSTPCIYQLSGRETRCRSIRCVHRGSKVRVYNSWSEANTMPQLVHFPSGDARHGGLLPPDADSSLQTDGAYKQSNAFRNCPRLILEGVRNPRLPANFECSINSCEYGSQARLSLRRAVYIHVRHWM